MNFITCSKKCSKCGKTKTADYFHKYHKNSSGLSSQCKECKGVKDVEVHKPLPEVIPQTWLRTYVHRWACLCCDARTQLRLIVDGTVIEVVTSIREAKALARQGEVYCVIHDSCPPTSLKEKLKAKTRKGLIEERIAEADALVDLEMQADIQPKLKEDHMDNPDFLDAYAHEVAVDKYMRRKLTSKELDAMDKRLPVITPRKARTIKSKEGMSYDILFDSTVRSEY